MPRAERPVRGQHVGMVQWIFGAFLIVHGLIHPAVWSTPKPTGQKAPFDPSHSWLLGDARGLASALAVTVAVLYAIAGVGVFVDATWWQALTVATSAVSLALILLTFNPWLLAGIAIDATLIVGVAFYDWPSIA
jgi:hypothetical protein